MVPRSIGLLVVVFLTDAYKSIYNKTHKELFINEYFCISVHEGLLLGMMIILYCVHKLKTLTLRLPSLSAYLFSDKDLGSILALSEILCKSLYPSVSLICTINKIPSQHISQSWESHNSL